jgi:hypothetical protein
MTWLAATSQLAEVQDAFTVAAVPCFGMLHSSQRRHLP